MQSFTFDVQKYPCKLIKLANYTIEYYNFDIVMLLPL